MPLHAEESVANQPRVHGRSRLGESNPGPTHYECVALAN
jgi:hypothetical protein